MIGFIPFIKTYKVIHIMDLWTYLIHRHGLIQVIA